MPRYSLRTKLTLSFSIVIVAGVFLFAIVGIRMIGNTVIRQAQDKVRLDLNSAREVYVEEGERIKDIVRLTAKRFFLKGAIANKDRQILQSELQKIREYEDLDMLTLVDGKGYVIIRARNPEIYGDRLSDNVVSKALLENIVVMATQIIPQEALQKEGNDLVEQARIEFIPTPKARPRTEDEETSGMAIGAAAPVFDDDRNTIGVLYGATLLNRNYRTVDKVKDIVYRGEQYKGQDIGTATIFQDDLRISTNVIRSDGTRAIGTRVSEEVYEHVIGQGIPWIGRAFVVNAWYRTAYEPIKDIDGKIIGMLYVGMLEAPYIDLRNRVVFTFLAIAFVSVILLSIISYFSTTKITEPIKKLLRATDKVAQGDLSQRVKIKSEDEIGQLAHSFNHMTEELEKATHGYLTLTRTLEQKVREKTEELEKTQDQLIQSEKLTSLGKLAAGIAHEINNPLTSILLNSHLVSEKLEGENTLKNSLKLIIDETKRCSTIVKGLLEFSRQSPPEKQLADMNEIIESTLLLFESQLLFHNVKIDMDLNRNMPNILVDVNKIKQVLTNIILNALDAMPDHGTLSIKSGNSRDRQYVEVSLKDTGHGIPKENVSRIFDPFFTTKGTKGTGLGLSVSYGIIQQHNGSIDAHSKVGKGTIITIRLPINGSKYNSKKGERNE